VVEWKPDETRKPRNQANERFKRKRNIRDREREREKEKDVYR
jgi:hypothetical protein